jgi:uncharacterized membrane protein
VPDRSASLLEPLATFVLEVLPWALSSLIVLYLAWGLWLAPQLPTPRAEPPVVHNATAVVTTVPATQAM